MDFGKAITYVFEDRRWLTKLLIGTVITFVPILNFSLPGYFVEIVRRLMRRESEILPEWDNIGKNFMDGLMLWIVQLIYGLPMLLLLCLFAVPLLPQLLSDSVDQDILNTLSGVGLLLLVCGVLLLILYSLFLSFILPALLIQYAQHNTIGACFRFGELRRVISQNAGDYFMLWLGIIGISFAISIVFSIVFTVLNFIPCIGQVVSILLFLPSGVYLGAVIHHLIGQFAAKTASANTIP
ncbi:MAG: DUF4013 domain-containing protein [Anaerolineales bacterium]